MVQLPQNNISKIFVDFYNFPQTFSCIQCINFIHPIVIKLDYYYQIELNHMQVSVI